MKILVTGGAGYLGSTLVPDLLELGHNVTVIDNFMYKQSSLNHICHKENFNIIKADVRIESVMKSLIKEADVIYYDKSAGHGIDFEGHSYQVIKLQDVVIVL
jgi:nucleoside-diphosphate-sugar epimerase